MEESLFLNTIGFEFPTESKTFYFSQTDGSANYAHFNGGNIPPNIGNDNLWFL